MNDGRPQTTAAGSVCSGSTGFRREPGFAAVSSGFGQRPGRPYQVDTLVPALQQIIGIFNFAPSDLKVPEKVVVSNERLAVGIMSLSFKVKCIVDGGDAQARGIERAV